MTQPVDSIEQQEPRSISQWLDLLIAGKFDERAADALGRMVMAMRPMELLRLDDTAARCYYAVKPGDVDRFTYGGTGMLGVFASNASGYVREKSVLKLASIRDGSELPFLLLRLNDWVKQVRDVARAAVVERIRAEYAAHFVRNLPLVFHLEQQSREDHRPIVEAVVELLSRPEHLDVVKTGMQSSDRLTRRIALRLAIAAAGARVGAILDLALRSQDPVMRLAAAKTIRKRFEGNELREWLQRLSKDRYFVLRREALLGAAESFPSEAEESLKDALLDPHSSMRELARFYLRQRGEGDFAPRYRERLSAASPSQLVGAIGGLSETGGPDDALLIAAFLSHANARVRGAAVRAIGRLDGDSYIEQLVAAMADERAGVRDAARIALVGRLHLIGAKRLWARFVEEKRPYVRRFFLWLISKLDRWASIPLLLRACGCDEERLRDSAMGYVSAWKRRYNRAFTQPTVEQVEQFDLALKQNESRLSYDLARQLHGILDQVKRCYRCDGK